MIAIQLLLVAVLITVAYNVYVSEYGPLKYIFYTHTGDIYTSGCMNDHHEKFPCACEKPRMKQIKRIRGWGYTEAHRADRCIIWTKGNYKMLQYHVYGVGYFMEFICHQEVRLPRAIKEILGKVIRTLAQVAIWSFELVILCTLVYGVFGALTMLYDFWVLHICTFWSK